MSKRGKCILWILLSIILISAAGIIESNLAGTQESVSSYALAIEYGGDSLEVWEVLDEIYLFLPSYFDRDETWLKTENCTISLDGRSAVSEVCIGTLDDTHYSYVITGDGIEKSGDLYVFQSSGTATVYIETESGSMDAVDADKDYKESGTILVIDENGGIEADTFLTHIKSRGNASWNTDKKSYGIKLSANIDLLGMGASDDWVLISNVLDASKIMNKMCNEMADAIGLEYTTECEWVDLWLNGEYHGNYLLCEKVEVDSGRIEEYDGCLIEMDGYYTLDEEYLTEPGFITADGNPFSIHYPDEPTDSETSRIAEMVQSIETAILSGDMDAAGSLLDWDSFILRYLMDETMYKHDMGTSSMYFYVSDGKLYSGPVWDYDNALGQGRHSYWMDYTFIAAVDVGNYHGGPFLTWYPVLYENEWFISRVAEMYEDTVRPYLIWLLEEGIDEYADASCASVKMDMERWDYAAVDAGHYDEYENNIRYLKYFLANRLEFLDQEWLGEENDYGWEGDGSTHTVMFEGANGTVEIEVTDGDVITETPDYLLDGGTWYLEGRSTPVNEYLPILEDMTFVEVVDTE